MLDARTATVDYYASPQEEALFSQGSPIDFKENNRIELLDDEQIYIGVVNAELMVVVALVGTLAAVAIPNYNKFVNRTRQAEAKILLAGIYTAEFGFYAENNSYSSCLKQIGYEPIGLSRFNFFETPAYAGGPGLGQTGKGLIS